jgi:glycosidase
MLGDGKHHPAVRRDFPGGWAGDSADYFTGRSAGAVQQDMFNYYQKLLQWRKTSTAIHNGRLTQFVPDSNVYVYFRHTPSQQVMVVINGSKKSRTLVVNRYEERLRGSKAGMDIISGAQIDLNKDLKLEGQSAMIIEIPYKLQ